ncbi:MAG: FAM114 family protein [Sedimenticola sp.]|nr:FAM114 family protein [Sedimenticola sp.]
MKRKKLLRKLADYLDLDRRAMLEKRDKIKQILKQLKEKEKRLQKKTDEEQDEEKKAIYHRELAILRAQRRKGINSLRELRR